ncbi:thioredoxin reductase [Nocardia sp. Root136]|uniref:NAD(P)/FAD-dependent oxidoreductase n=1 Tax=Nocardia sp. Root136 TaxID=1736458 RepID=UPI0006FD1835|nr:NAD(P)/FAD-dependent oxidoreductase [Nocardia sp. Root136]KQY32522.1 thioredoxin reductase [Nocardia sp. Root136]
MLHDVVVIGGGTAGLGAALVLARSRRQVVVIDSGAPRNMAAENTHGFLTRDGATPTELLAVGTTEALRYGAQLLGGRVVELAEADTGFAVETETGQVITARSVVVATGLRDELPAIPGVREQWGKGVLHCPYCHGYEVRDQPLAVLGGANRAFSVHQASLVRQWSDDVTFFPREIDLSADERRRLSARGIRIVEGEIAQVVVRDGELHGVEIASGQVITRTAVFVGPCFSPRDELLNRSRCTVGEDGWVAVDATGHTSVPGVWAAGNVVDSPAQLIHAAAAGSRAAVAVNHYLLEQDIQRALS